MKTSKIVILAALGFLAVSGQANAACNPITNPSSCIGPQGPAGQDGAPGTNGQDGAPGANGAPGADGAPGIPGVAGLDGAPGPKGDKGDKGDQGIQGNQGNQGFQGDKGDKGDAGPKGDKGDQGVAGNDGAKGDKGDNGADGKDGVAGLNGKNYDPADLEQGLATTSALNVPHIDIGKQFGVSGSAGFYNNEAAIGLGATIRFDDTWQLGGSIATDTEGKNVAGKAVVTGQW